MQKRVKPLLDRLLAVTVSKKLSVMIVATVMVFMGIELQDNWVIVAGIYLGIQGIIDIFKEKMKAKNNDPFGNSSYPIGNNDNLEK